MIKPFKVLLMLLMGCSLLNSCAGAPTPPIVPIFIPIINRTICTPDHVCTVHNECQEFAQNPGDSVSPSYHFVKSWELKKCDGIFGTPANTWAEIRTYVIKMHDYIAGLISDLSACKNEQ